MKDTTSNMVAPLNPLELTAAQINVESLSRLTTWKVADVELERRYKQEVPNPKYLMPNYHIVSIGP